VNGAELVHAFRQRSDDLVTAGGEYLYGSTDLYRFATEGETEACLRAKLLYDTTSSFLRCTVVAGTSSYALDPRVDRIDRVVLTLTSGGRPKDLRIVGIDHIHDRADWHSQTGRPCLAAHVDRRLVLWPTPTAAYVGTVQLHAYRLPKYPIEDDGDEPEIPVEHHEGLVDWMLFRAYSTKDGEAGDPERAAAAERAFTIRFGPRPDADTLRRHRERRRVTTRYGGC
jgi:hypothetical protein